MTPAVDPQGIVPIGLDADPIHDLADVDWDVWQSTHDETDLVLAERHRTTARTMAAAGCAWDDDYRNQPRRPR